MKKLMLIYIVLMQSVIANTPFTTNAHVITAPGGSNRFMVMVPNNKEFNVLNNQGRGKCIEVQDDGSFKQLWTIPWFAQLDFLYLHYDGESLLRLHHISADKKLSKNNHEKQIVISFYHNGSLVRSVRAGEIIDSYKKVNTLTKTTDRTYVIFNRVELGDFSMSDMGFVIYEDALEKKLRKESIFCVTTIEKDKLYFTSKGKLINRVKK